MDEAHAVLERRLLVLLGRLERATEVVEHRQELLHEPLVRARDERLLVARGPLAEVLELRLQALEPVDELVALGDELVGLLDLLFLVLDLFVHYEVFASSSSMTSYSPSSTTSSSEVGAPLPVGEACACAVACA